MFNSVESRCYLWWPLPWALERVCTHLLTPRRNHSPPQMNMKSQATPTVSHAASTLPYNFTHLHQKPTSYEVFERVEAFTEIGGSWEGSWEDCTIQQQAIEKSHIQHPHFEKSSDTSALGVFMALNGGLLSVSLLLSPPSLFTALRSPLLGTKSTFILFSYGAQLLHLLWSLCQHSWF